MTVHRNLTVDIFVTFQVMSSNGVIVMPPKTPVKTSEFTTKLFVSP